MTEQNPETIETDESKTFTAEYVKSLRDEAAGHRTRAKAAEEALTPLQERLFSILVEKTGRLADPTDLTFDASLLEDEEALTGAIDALLEAKPHLASRRVVGDIGQGAGTPVEGEVSLAALLHAGV